MHGMHIQVTSCTLLLEHRARDVQVLCFLAAFFAMQSPQGRLMHCSSLWIGFSFDTAIDACVNVLVRGVIQSHSQIGVDRCRSNVRDQRVCPLQLTATSLSAALDLHCPSVFNPAPGCAEPQSHRRSAP